LAGFVERALKQALMEGDLRPGERLVARDLAARLGTSVTPVREALLKLVASGALDASPAQSFQVPSLTPEQFQEIAEIRKAVEGLAAERAIGRVTSEDVARLRAINGLYKEARRHNDARRALHHNKEFRLYLYERANMPSLFSLIETLWLKIGPSLNYLFPVHPAESSDLHNYDVLIEALEGGDRATVVRTLHRSIDEGTAAILDHMSAAYQGAEATAAPA
jgi:GntR family colanic acid and biofilm gene transcriptional regulator